MGERELDPQDREDSFLGMSKGWQKAGVVLAFIVQLGMIFFWGGAMNSKMDQLRLDFDGFRDQVVDNRQAQAERIRSLEVDVAVAEALTEACVSQSADQIDMESLKEDVINGG